MIANPQILKRLGHFLTADYKSTETPNGRQATDANLQLIHQTLHIFT